MLGETLGPYRIDKELGSGGMGKVYAATVAGRVPGIAEGTQVALKIVHAHLLETPGFFRRFLREADIGKSVVHENVVQTYDADALSVDGAQHNFLVMEYVEGQTLRDLITELDRVPEELCRHIGREVARGLDAIHAAGVVHRDMKPENVLITDHHAVKVMDLGVARLTDEAIRLSQSGAFVGSLHYAAPEQFSKGGSEVDHRADLHALGLVLYELSCGRHPFQHDEMRRVMHAVVNDQPRGVAEINPQLSPFFEEVVHKLLAKDRAERFETAEELADVLEEGEGSSWWKDHAKSLRIETKQPLRRIHIPRETALYGRDDDLAKLASLYEKAKAGDGQVLLVEGEAGIGKTRLVDEFVGKLRQDGEDLNFLFGSYPPGGAATAAGGFSTAYREQFGSAGLTQVLETYLAETPVLIPAFSALLRGEPTPEGKQPLTKESLQTVFVHATRALAAERTTLVLIDDLHFAPEDGRGLFSALSLALPGHRVLLVGTTRPGVLPEEYVAELERPEHASRLSLDRLGPKDLMGMLEDTLGSERLAEELGLQIVLKSDGNPFFVFEILRALREGKLITQSADGTWARTQVIEQIQIPSSVMDLIEARLVDLDDEDRELLDVAACCGFEFDGTLVAATLEIKRIPAFRRLGRIEKKLRLVRSAGRNYVFDHHQVQEALYDGLAEVLREEYHAAIAEALEDRENAAEKDPKEIDGALALDLCEHFFKGARGEQGLRYLEAALEHLEAGYLIDPVIALADRALASGDLLAGEERCRILIRKGLHHGHLGQRTRFGVALEEAMEIADEHGDARLRCDALGAFCWHLWALGRYHEAQAILVDALGIVEDAEQRAALSGRLSVVLSTLGHHEEALELEQTGPSNRGLLYQDTGRYAEALACFEAAQATHEPAGPRARIGQLNQGTLEAALGDPEQGRSTIEEARAALRSMGARRPESYAVNRLGEVAEQMGRLEEADALYAQALSLRREIAYPSGVSESLVALGRLRKKQGQDVDALLPEAQRVARDLDLPNQLVLSTVYLDGGDAAEAALESLGPRMRVRNRIEAHLELWRTTSKAEHLAEAFRLQQHVLAHSPEDRREAMLANVPLHRDVAAAWEAHGA